MAEFRGGEVVAIPMPVGPDMVVWALPGPMGDIPYTEVENLVEAEVGEQRDHMDAVKVSVDQSRAHIDLTASHVDSQAAAAAGSADVATSKALQASGSASTATTKASEASVSAADAQVFRNQAEGFATSANTDATTATTQAGIATSKAGEAVASAFTLSQRVDVGAKEIAYTSDGKPYLLPEAEVEELHYRVDKSIGTRVFVGDTMIHGDTGDRDMRHLLPEGWTATTFRLRRVGQLVTIAIVELKPDVTSGSTSLLDFIPQGFLPNPRHMFPLAGVSYVQLNTAGGLSFISISGNNIQGVIAFHTHQNWPVSLPGIPG